MKGPTEVLAVAWFIFVDNGDESFSAGKTTLGFPDLVGHARAF